MKIVVDFDKCKSNAVCMARRARGVRGAGRQLPLRPPGGAAGVAAADKVEEAVRTCPTGAITIEGEPGPAPHRRCDHDRRRRHVARGAARGRDPAPRRLRRPARRGRRRAAPALRPAAAVEGASSPATATATRSCCASRASTTSTSSCRLGVAAHALDVARRTPSALDDDDRRVRRAGDRDRRARRARSRTNPTSTACSRCARSTTRRALRALLDAERRGCA